MAWIVNTTRELSLAEKLAHPDCSRLSLKHADVAYLATSHFCRSLEELAIKPSITERNLSDELQTPLDVDTIIHYMEQPSMRKLVLCDVRVINNDAKIASDYPAIENLNQPSRLSSLELRQVHITRNNLVSIFRACSDLRSFTWTEPADNRDAIFLHEIASALRPVSYALTSLKLDYHSIHKASDHSLLTPLHDLRSLLHLNIDPSMYIGRQLCPHHPHHPPTLAYHPVTARRPPYSFADILPNGLETLTLSIDIEQVMRLKNYRRDIMHSIIDARARLPNLKEINLLEDERSWTKVNVCSCGMCYQEMGRVWRVQSRRNADERQERQEFVKVLRKMDVRLFRDVGDGSGRYECTAWGNA